MKQPKSRSTRLAVLAVLLVFGPLQATVTFACEMMETVVLEVCCCNEAPAGRKATDDENECAGSAMSSTASVPCCEQAATVGIDADVFKATAHSKSTGKTPATPSDVDPPDAGIVDSRAGSGLPVLPPAAAPFRFTEIFSGDGSALWLTTGRLRI